MSMQRRPEAELMDDVAQAAAYAGADFSAANELFVDSLMARCQLASGAHVLDLGCGPADIPCRLAARIPGIHIDAIDGAAAMLALARRAVAAASLDDRITLIQQHIYPGMPFAGRYDAIISNSLLHHLDDPMTLWEVIRDNLPAGAAVVIMDLCRPVSEAAVSELVTQYAANDPPVLRHDFRASLHAAYTRAEVTAQLQAAGLTWLHCEVVSDRHLLVAPNPAHSS